MAAAAMILRRAAGPARRAAWKLMSEPQQMVMVARASAAPVMQRCQNTPLRFASTAREAAAGQDSALLRVLKSEIDHEAEEYEPSRVNFSLLCFGLLGAFFVKLAL